MKVTITIDTDDARTVIEREAIEARSMCDTVPPGLAALFNEAVADARMAHPMTVRADVVMSAYDELRCLIGLNGDDTADGPNHAADAIIAAGWRSPEQVEELLEQQREAIAAAIDAPWRPEEYTTPITETEQAPWLRGANAATDRAIRIARTFTTGADHV